MKGFVEIGSVGISQVALACFILFSCGLAMAKQQPSEGKNLLPNGSFEEEEKGKPKDWKEHAWHEDGGSAFSYASPGRTGRRCVSISSEKGGDLSWETFVTVLPFSTYKLSGWIKTENLVPTSGTGALLNIHATGVKTEALTDTQDWTRVEVAFETYEDDTLHINCLFGGWGMATGKAWYDDLQLELIKTQSMKPDITVDLEKTGPPISELIYGQFIEHLGRCIYGGIWAEMLEDRKFFDPVGSPGSPWQVVGDAKSAQMVKEEPFVGEQDPQIKNATKGQPAGIVQKHLGLKKGASYEGRIVLKGDKSVGPIEVWLSWEDDACPDHDGTDAKRVMIQSTSQYKTTPFSFTAGKTTDEGRLFVVARGQGTFRVGTVSLMPQDNVKGMRKDTLALLKELNAPIYRWPGGNFVSGYDWKDGIGDRDKRPPRKNPAWKGIEHNDFGLDEFMTFCKEIHTEPLIVVNSGLGGVEMALQELEYVNGDEDTPMGKLRAQNGQETPYAVVWWGVGNEMYGNWQLGHMPLEKYVLKHNTFAEAMREKDPYIKLVAVGATGPWSETMLRECADHMDLLSEHFYVQERQGLLSHVRQMPDSVRRKAEAHKKYHETLDSLSVKRIPIALDEWNYWYGPHLYGELGVRYFLRDALGVAAGLHEMTRYSDIFAMANYAQTVNVIGAIKTTKRDACFATTGLALKLYRERYGKIPVSVSGETALLDVAAALTEDRKALTVGVVNPTSKAIDLPLRLKGRRCSDEGVRWVIAGADPMAYNAPGEPPQVVIKEEKVKGIRGKLQVPALAALIYRLELE